MSYDRHLKSAHNAIQYLQTGTSRCQTNKMAEEQEVSSAASSLSPKTTVKDLQFIITEPAGGFYMMPNDAYNEVFNGIFIGEA